jgi:hypothetical protein
MRAAWEEDRHVPVVPELSPEMLESERHQARRRAFGSQGNSLVWIALKSTLEERAHVPIAVARARQMGKVHRE